MKNTKWLIITLAAAVTAGGLFVLKTQAAERAGLQRPSRGRLLERAKEELALSDDQVTKIKTELQTEKDSLKSLILKLHEARVTLRQTIQAADATETSVRAASAKAAAVEADLAVARLKLFGKINPILTPDQREKVKHFQSKVDDLIDGAINKIGERLATQ
jgi:Spy/CpxP family protein refolding chaperone